MESPQAGPQGCIRVDSCYAECVRTDFLPMEQRDASSASPAAHLRCLLSRGPSPADTEGEERSGGAWSNVSVKGVFAAVNHASFLVLQGPDQGARFELTDQEVGLGRGVQNTIRIHDTEVSRCHAQLNQIGERYVLTDLNSSNGTYVNGHAIKSRELSDGDQLQVGRTVLLFSVFSPTESKSAWAQEQVAFLPRHDPQDRSAIVSAAGHQDVPIPSAGDLSKSPSVAPILANLQVLYRISEESVRPSISLEELLSRVLQLTLEVTGADRGCILLRHPESGELVPEVLRGRQSNDEVSSRMPIPRSIVEYVLQTRQGVRTTDARNETRFTPGESVFQAGVREALCVPMQGRYELLGVIYVDITTPSEQMILTGAATSRFNEDLLRLLLAIGRQSALAVEDNRYRQALLKSERLAAVGQTIAILSHHIKNILQGVRGGSYLIDLGLKDANQDLVRKGWQIVEKNQDKIYHLVMDMLSLGKERQPALKRDDVNQIVSDVCELMQSRAQEMQVRFDVKLDETLPPTQCDGEGIHRAVLNVVTNALDAVEERDIRQVLVETTYDPQGRMFRVIVTDNGPGMTPEQQSRLFNLFESTKGARGTGIGLSVSRKIIREHGGDILVSSTPGVGSRFIIEWPLMADEQVPIEATITF